MRPGYQVKVAGATSFINGPGQAWVAGQVAVSTKPSMWHEFRDAQPMFPFSKGGFWFMMNQKSATT